MNHTKRETFPQAKGQVDLNYELLKWAVDEMGFRPQGRHVDDPLPKPEDLKHLSRGAMSDVWKFLIRYVKSAKNSQKIKGNIKVQQLLQNNPTNKACQPGEKQKLLSQYNNLTNDLAELTEKVHNVENELKHLEKEVLSLEQQRETVSKVVADYQTRSALLSAHKNQCNTMIQAYRGLNSQLSNKMDAMTIIDRSSCDTTYYSVQWDPCKVSMTTPARPRDKKEGFALESSCTKLIRETCDSIGSYLNCLCDGSVVQQSTDAENIINRDHLWTQVEGILREQPSDEVLSSLVLTTQDSTIDLKELTSLIDLNRDAEELKFLYQKGKLTDTSQPPSLVQSVHQLIEEGQRQHFKCFVEAERAANEAWKLLKELQALNKTTENRMESRYRGLPGTADLARMLYYCKLELTSAKSSLTYLQTATRALEISRMEKLTALETIQSKYDKIKDFEKQVQIKQSVIQALVKQNFAVRMNLEKQKHELLSYIQSQICPHQSHIAAMVTGLQHAVSRDVDKFTLIPITRLQYVDMPGGERIPADDLTIHRLEDLSNRPGGAAIGQVLEKLDFPFYKAPEELLPRIMEIKETVEDTSILVCKRERDITEMEEENATKEIVDELNSLQHQVKSQDMFEANQITPHVQAVIKKASKALSECISVKDLATAWWEQPAQFLVPWVKVDDMNSRQWLDQLTLYTTRLRQLQMHHQG